MSARPGRIRIGSLTYRLIADADAVRAESEANAGPSGAWTAFSNHDHLVIGVNPESAPGVQKVDVIHEVLHCCLRASGVWPDSYAAVVHRADGFNDGQSVEEVMVSAAAGPFLGVMRDNPDLIAWLLDEPHGIVRCTCGVSAPGTRPPFPVPAAHGETCPIRALAP